MKEKRILPEGDRTSLMISIDLGRELNQKKPPHLTKQQWVDYLLRTALNQVCTQNAQQKIA